MLNEVDIGPAAGHSPQRCRPCRQWISRDQQVTNYSERGVLVCLVVGRAMASSVSVSELVGSAMGERSAVMDSVRLNGPAT